jgi:hypothetical protein
VSDTGELAALVGVAPDVLVRALGDGWAEVAGPEHERWFVSGRPAQVAVGWDGFGFTLARPEPRWAGNDLVWEFVADRRFSSDEVLYERAVLAEAAEEVARRRRPHLPLVPGVPAGQRPRARARQHRPVHVLRRALSGHPALSRSDERCPHHVRTPLVGCGQTRPGTGGRE